MSTRSKMVQHAFYSTAYGFCRTLIDGVGKSLVSPRNALAFWDNINEYYDLNRADRKLNTRPIQDVIPFDDEPDINIIGSYYSRRASDTRILMELAAIAYIMRALEPKIVFEIGTFVGRTTRTMAINSPDFTQLYTLDLPPSESQAANRVGSEYRKSAESKKITQLFGDSGKFDFSPYYNKCDFVWVDANHDYNPVKTDSENALSLCKKGGWIGWHDYRHSAPWSGVTRCIRELNAIVGNIVHVQGTTIALLQKT